MTSLLDTPNGMPLYMVSKLVNDFSTIFCQALGDSIYFIGARDHLAISIEIFNRDKSFFSRNDASWNMTYAFDSNEVKRNLDWFRKKANSTKNKRLNIELYDSQLHISNNIVDAQLNSITEKPPIPGLPKMEDGVYVKLIDLKEMVNQVRSIQEGVLKLTLFNSEVKMSGSTHIFPVYNVSISNRSNNNGNNIEISALCLKDMLLISCQLASEVGSQSADLRFYPNGATQVSSQGDNVSVRCLITAVKR